MRFSPAVDEKVENVVENRWRRFQMSGIRPFKPADPPHSQQVMDYRQPSVIRSTSQTSFGTSSSQSLDKQSTKSMRTSYSKLPAYLYLEETQTPKKKINDNPASYNDENGTIVKKYVSKDEHYEFSNQNDEDEDDGDDDVFFDAAEYIVNDYKIAGAGKKKITTVLNQKEQARKPNVLVGFSKEEELQLVNIQPDYGPHFPSPSTMRHPNELFFRRLNVLRQSFPVFVALLIATILLVFLTVSLLYELERINAELHSLSKSPLSESDETKTSSSYVRRKLSSLSIESEDIPPPRPSLSEKLKRIWPLYIPLRKYFAGASSSKKKTSGTRIPFSLYSSKLLFPHSPSSTVLHHLSPKQNAPINQSVSITKCPLSIRVASLSTGQNRTEIPGANKRETLVTSSNQVTVDPLNSSQTFPASRPDHLIRTNTQAIPNGTFLWNGKGPENERSESTQYNITASPVHFYHAVPSSSDSSLSAAYSQQIQVRSPPVEINRLQQAKSIHQQHRIHATQTPVAVIPLVSYHIDRNSKPHLKKNTYLERNNSNLFPTLLVHSVASNSQGQAVHTRKVESIEFWHLPFGKHLCRIPNVARAENGRLFIPKWMEKYTDFLKTQCGLRNFVFGITVTDQRVDIDPFVAKRELGSLYRISKTFANLDLFGQTPPRHHMPHFVSDVFKPLIAVEVLLGTSRNVGRPYSMFMTKEGPKLESGLSKPLSLRPALLMSNEILEKPASDWVRRFASFFETPGLAFEMIQLDPTKCKGEGCLTKKVRLFNSLFSIDTVPHEPYGLFGADRKNIVFSLNGISRDYPWSVKSFSRSCHISITALTRNGSRALLGLKELEQLIETKAIAQNIETSFRIVDFSLMSFDDQVRTMQDTHVLIATHGAGNANIIFMRPGAAFVEVFPFSYKAGPFDEFAKIFGMEYFVAMSAPQTDLFKSCMIRHERNEQIRKMVFEKWDKAVKEDKKSPWVHRLEFEKEFGERGKSQGMATRSCVRAQQLKFDVNTVTDIVVKAGKSQCHLASFAK